METHKGGKHLVHLKLGQRMTRSRRGLFAVELVMTLGPGIGDMEKELKISS